MIYPSVTQYIDSLQRASSNFQSSQLKRISLCLDEMNEPIYFISKSSGSLLFDVMLNKEKKVLRVFLNQQAADNYFNKLGTEATIYRRELRVTSPTAVELFDIAIESTQTKSKQTKIQNITELREDRIAFLSSNGKWGYKNSKNEIVIAPEFDSAGLFYESRAVVSIGDRFGLIDNFGKKIIETIYDEVAWDNSAFATVELNGQFGVIDRLGTLITPTEWDWIAEFSNGAFVVEKDSKFGYLDRFGRALCEIKYDDATSICSENYGIAHLGDKKFYTQLLDVESTPQLQFNRHILNTH